MTRAAADLLQPARAWPDLPYDRASPSNGPAQATEDELRALNASLPWTPHTPVRQIFIRLRGRQQYGEACGRA